VAYYTNVIPTGSRMDPFNTGAGFFGGKYYASKAEAEAAGAITGGLKLPPGFASPSVPAVVTKAAAVPLGLVAAVVALAVVLFVMWRK
jgi:hypothetical protein